MDESKLVPKAIAFRNDVSGYAEGWLARGEDMGYTGCWSGPPRYERGVEVLNAQRIVTTSADGATHRYYASRFRDVECSQGYRWSRSEQACVHAGPDPRKQAGPSCPAEGNPINAATGNNFDTRTVYRGTGPFPLELTVTYNSVDLHDTAYKPGKPFGERRRHSYERTVTLVGGPALATAFVLRPDGRVLMFAREGEDWIPDPDITARLERLTDAGGDPAGWK
ncbi:MAG: hypothetical protein GWN34_18715, partial [Gammaproteobacteria bacterium]|nr:hypothetical protein [Gammaproteobacteria bacterium]NIW04072.1 hypothetical protein [Gammaproteobacteria bacterium]